MITSTQRTELEESGFTTWNSFIDPTTLETLRDYYDKILYKEITDRWHDPNPGNAGLQESPLINLTINLPLSMRKLTGILLLALLAPFAAAQENPFIPTEENSWVPDLSGWKLEAATHEQKDGTTLEGWRIADTGKAPFRLESIDGRIWINNPDLTTASALDPMGRPGTTLPLERSGSTASLTLPTDAIYLILE